jgi:hypothetical protein
MGKVIPTASFRRAARPQPNAVAAFVELDDAPGDTPVEVEDSAPATPAIALAQTATNDAEPVDVVRPSKRSSPKRWRRKTLVRADGRELRKQTFYLDAELSHRLMVTCAAHQYDLSEAIEEAVNSWLKSK